MWSWPPVARSCTASSMTTASTRGASPWIGPIHGEAPRVDAVVIEDAVQLRATGGQDHIGRARGRQRAAVEIRVVQEVHAIDDHALLGRCLAEQHVAAIDGAGVLLDDVVAGAGRYVISVRPHRRTWVIGEQRPQEFVAIVRAERIGARAHRITHRERTLLLGWPQWADSWCRVGRRRRRRRHRWRDEQRRWAPGGVPDTTPTAMGAARWLP